ncbi:MAG: ABC transporter ATP-binding protein [bacterium]
MLKITDLHVYYGNIHILKGVCLEINEREIVTLIGANGAGKTTLLMTISGIVKAKKGEIEFLGKRIERFSPPPIVSLGITHVPEGRRIFPRLTVMENLLLGAYLRHNKKEIKEDMERIFGFFPILKERRWQLGGTLSGGEQQMLAIGRGLMMRPKLLLLDEPSLGLSPKLVHQIFDIITIINQQGTTIFLVEQNANMALKIANYGYCLETGSIVLKDKANNLLNNEMVKKAYLG